ncbi:MAG: pyrroloquinoline quinone biosynthesis protein PqqE [candidate division BRC1 bacterium ADurb.BinA364]|nr:MAG: pyrroloquinoline quinone biosynthesis protein PqqE [candidate division BRC1 bacterium ADurb.BinA364]
MRCQGCWVSVDNPAEMAEQDAGRLIDQAKRYGVRFFGILGGEPLLHPRLFAILEKHPECYFQLFTNGTAITEAAAREMRRLGNISPLISIEGLEQVSDERRGGRNVYAKALAGLERCRRERLVAGIATSVCQSNIGELAAEAFIDECIRRGAHYLWYYIYRPVGAIPAPELALRKDQIAALRRFIVAMRSRKPILLVDAYWDHQGRGLCPAAVGLSYHVNARGDLEPCPPLQFASENLLDGRDIFDAVNRSAFLREFSKTCAETTRGCIILEDPAKLKALVERMGARATSGRDGLAELAAMAPKPSHDLPDEAIPEDSWAYRFAKKHWFFGFGAYG